MPRAAGGLLGLLLIRQGAVVWVPADEHKFPSQGGSSRPLKDGGGGRGVVLMPPGLQSLGWWAVGPEAGAAEPGCCQVWQGPPWWCHPAAGQVVTAVGIMSICQAP